MSMREAIPPDWVEALQGIDGLAGLEDIESFVANQRRLFPDQIYPREEEVFAALKLTRVASIRAVVVGMDPYHRPDQAHGLAFSLRPGAKPFPPSLRHILDEVERDCCEPIRRDGNLEPWARGGVLLLNAALTVRQKPSGCHLKQWWPFTNAVIRAVDRRPEPVVFMLWGRSAERMRGLIHEPPHTVQVRSHPSPLAARKNFLGTAPFRFANDALATAGREPIDWRLPID